MNIIQIRFSSFFTRFLLFSQLIIIVILFTGCGGHSSELVINNGGNGGEISSTGDNTDISAGTLEANMISVHISGHVRYPGVYQLEAGSRLNDAIEMAGGFDKQADKDYANLAEVLEDGRKYEILAFWEVDRLNNSDNSSTSEDTHYDADGALDINAATESELCMLSGIGASKAQAIIAYREEHGAFTSREDIKNVPGIGDGIYARISSQITVR